MSFPTGFVKFIDDLLALLTGLIEKFEGGYVIYIENINVLSYDIRWHMFRLFLFGILLKRFQKVNCLKAADHCLVGVQDTIDEHSILPLYCMHAGSSASECTL